MREMTKSAVAVAAEALRVGEAALPRYASKYSRRDGYTLPQLFACLAVRKFLGQDYRGMEALLNEWSELRSAAGLSDKVPDHSTLCLAEAKLSAGDGGSGGGGGAGGGGAGGGGEGEGGAAAAGSACCCRGASGVRGNSACSTATPCPRPRSTRRGWRRGTRRPTSAAAAGATARGSRRTRLGPS